MIPVTQPLRDEHRALQPELGALRSAADAVGSASALDALDRARRLLRRHLLPHMAAEESVLYPLIDRIAGYGASATMRHDHDEIRRRMEALGAPHAPTETGRAAERDLRAELYGLDAIVRLHLAKEEELYYPLLDDSLDAADAGELFVDLHRAERDEHRRSRP